MSLLPAAFAALAVYVAGYPAFIAYMLYKNRELIMEDQLIRAKGAGDDKLTNPNALGFRRMWSRMYYQFKPDTYYWGFMIINRKLWLAVTFVIFNRNPAFQVAASMLVMFLSYTLQVRYQPYMSPNDCEGVLAHAKTMATVSPLYRRLNQLVAAIEARGRRRAHKNVLTSEGKVDPSAILGALSSVLFNYNTLEAVMLFGAVIVNLMGIMYAAQGRASSYYAEARDAVTSVVLFTIIACVLYFLTVVIVEIATLGQDAVTRRRKAAQAAKEKAKASGKSGKKAGVSGNATAAALDNLALGSLNNTFNPMFTNNGKDGNSNTTITVDDARSIAEPSVEVWHIFQDSFVSLSDKIEALNQKLLQLKIEEQTRALSRSAGGMHAGDEYDQVATRSPSMGPKAKREFDPVSTGVGGANPLRGSVRRLPGDGSSSPSMGGVRRTNSIGANSSARGTPKSLRDLKASSSSKRQLGDE
jgi:hypothetical protein